MLPELGLSHGRRQAGEFERKPSSLSRGTDGSNPVPSSEESVKCAAKRLDTGKLSFGSEEDQNILICVRQVALRRQCKRVYSAAATALIGELYGRHQGQRS